MIQTIEAKIPGVSISFKMDLDDSFIADRNTLAYTAMFGTPEPEVMEVMRHVLRKGDTCIDGGANIGYFSLLMASFVGPNGKVLAFEPGPNNIPKLKANLKLNRADNVIVIEQALWSRQTCLSLHMTVDSGQHSLAKPLHQESFGRKEVTTSTIDSWNVHNWPRLIKLDVEGSEIEAVIGGNFTITAHKPYIVCELNDDTLAAFGRTANDLRDMLLSLYGYHTFALHRNMPYPTLIPPKAKIVTQNQNTNVLFCTIDMLGEAWGELRLG